MTDQTENPYQLAQYIVAKPINDAKYDTFDGSPVLQKLEARLIVAFVETMLSGEVREQLVKNDNVNGLIKLLAEKADEFYPGKTMSDLLLKHEIVMRVAISIGDAIKKTVLNQFKSGDLGAASILESFLKSRR